MTAYEPGTVAAIQTRVIADDGGVAVRVKKHVLTNEPVWMWLTNGGVPRADGGFVRDENVIGVRPLMVLDLDALRGCWADTNSPAAIVERLRETNSVAAHAIADQIEAQTRPPKPEEPTGLGAVVEDAAGVRWVRAGDSHGGRLHDNWRSVATEGNDGWWSAWKNIDVPDESHILSRGVSDA